MANIFKRRKRPLATAAEQTEASDRSARESRQAIENQAQLIRARQLYAEVHAVFMEEEPRIIHCHKLARSKNIVVAPFFISDGLHSREDIPVMMGAPKAVVAGRLKLGQPPWRNPTERDGKRVWYTAAVGSEPRVADVILERVRQAASGADADPQKGF